MKLILLILVFSFTQTITAQYSALEIKSCKTTDNATYLNQIEKDVLYYINLVRINPKKFSEIILAPFLSKNPDYSKKYCKSLFKRLNKTTPLAVLKPAEDLFYFSRNHAHSKGKKGDTGHRSTKGKSFAKRTNKLIKKYAVVGENIHYGSNNALEIVIDLLIDDGIKDLGHRENILEKDFVYCSASIQKHKKFRYNCVIDFAGKKN
jgi:uncharacterized protein YkwD